MVGCLPPGVTLPQHARLANDGRMSFAHLIRASWATQLPNQIESKAQTIPTHTRNSWTLSALPPPAHGPLAELRPVVAPDWTCKR